jgi:hypothetical protein
MLELYLQLPLTLHLCWLLVHSESVPAEAHYLVDRRNFELVTNKSGVIEPIKASIFVITNLYWTYDPGKLQPSGFSTYDGIT